jgi:hypothetical protein
LLNIDSERNPLEDFGQFGFGSVRTLQQYEEYAGIKFETRSVQLYTVNHKEPPNPPGEEFVRVFKHCIDISYASIPHDDYVFWAVAFEDKDGNEIYREDASADEIKRMQADPDKYYKLWRIFYASAQPKKWVVWPLSEKYGWGDRLEGIV